MAKYSGPMHVPNKRTKKPQGAPKRAISAFLSFSQLMRPEIRGQYPNLKNTDVSSVLAQKWHEASEEEKRPHIERELRDREKYHEDMAAWKEGEVLRLAEEAGQAVSSERERLKGSPSGYASQDPSSSLWAAMIDVNGSSACETGSSGPPLYDEAMVGFWDTEMEGGDNQFGCSTGSEKSSEKGERTSRPRFSPPSSGALSFHQGSSNVLKAVKKETPLTGAKKSKEQRLAKRAKVSKESPNDTGVPHLSTASHTNLPLTAQQLEIQQRRLQQQHQYQMYQQHLLNQKHKGEKAKEESTHGQNQPRDTLSSSYGHGHASSRVMSSAGSIMEGGRLHSQAEAMRMQALDGTQHQLQLQKQQASYQGTQRSHIQQAPLPWPFGLSGFAGALDQQSLAQYPPTVMQPGMAYAPPIAAYTVDPYFSQPYGQLQYPASTYGYGLIDGIERYFYDAPAPQAPPQPQRHSTQGPESSSSRTSHSLCQSQLDGLTPLKADNVYENIPPKSMAPTSSNNNNNNQSHNNHISNNNSHSSNNSNSNKGVSSDPTSATSSSSSQSMRSFQFDEQDKFCVMQTLMAVHRASASRAGDSETLRSLDRMQMSQGNGQGGGGVQVSGSGGNQGNVGPGLGLGPPLPVRYLQDVEVQGTKEFSTLQDAGIRSSALRGDSQEQNKEDTHSAASSTGSGGGGGGQCCPLSVMQQERQNQAERQQLKDRQKKQMQDMLQLQEREQAEQIEEHSFSMVSASIDRAGT